MSEYNLSMVLIVPAVLQDKADRLSIALGHGSPTYVAPIGTDGSDKITHYGCRGAAIEDFKTMIEAAQQGQIPELNLSDVGLTITDVQQVLAALIADFVPAGTILSHYDDVLAANGLKRASFETLDASADS